MAERALVEVFICAWVAVLLRLTGGALVSVSIWQVNRVADTAANMVDQGQRHRFVITLAIDP